MAESKYYEAREAIAMLPLLKGYARDIAELHSSVKERMERLRKIANLTSASEKIQESIKIERSNLKDTLENNMRTYERWKAELKVLHISLCNPLLGRLDMPVYDDQIEGVIYLCVLPETTAENIEWHAAGENCEQARPFFDRVT